MKAPPSGVFPIDLPRFRNRKEDIPLLASHFLEREKRKLGRPHLRLTRAALLVLKGYDSPGNIRQLQNTIQRAAILTVAGPLRFDLPGNAAEPARDPGPGRVEVLTEAQLRQLERENIIEAPRRLAPHGRLLLQSAIFGAAVAALPAGGRHGWAMALAAAVALNTALMAVCRQ